MAEAVALALTKPQTQGSPYNWVWATRNGDSVADKPIGTGQFSLRGANDTELLRKINAHEGIRSKRHNLNPHD